MSRVNVIIPTYKPDEKFLTLIDRLEKQTVKPERIIIMNTEQKYYDRLIYGSHFQDEYKNVEVYHISKREFDHGRTRHMAMKRADGEFVLLMTQDAVPADLKLIEHLLSAFHDEKTAVAYARQLPAKDSGVIESYTRAFNYPETSMVKSAEDIEKLGIKTYFCSNVCAMYRKSAYEELGGFVRHTIFNEDMIFAAEAVKSGYKIAYKAEAQVVHSHNYTNMEQLKRNFDLGVSQADHPEIFAGLSSGEEGVKLVRQTADYLRKSGNRRLIGRLYFQSGCKYAGYLLGKNYKKLPKKLVGCLTSNKTFWDNDNRIKDSTRIDATKGYGKTEEELKMRERQMRQQK